MPQSLTSFLPFLAERLGMSVNALYERQRALIRHGLLQKPVGRGRGSGVNATSHSVARLLLSLLASDGLSESAEAAKLLGTACLNPNAATGPFRKCETFIVALEHVLDRPGLKVAAIVVVRPGNHAVISLMAGKAPNLELENFYFDPLGEGASPEPGLLVKSTLTHDFISEVARTLAEINQ